MAIQTAKATDGTGCPKEPDAGNGKQSGDLQELSCNDNAYRVIAVSQPPGTQHEDGRGDGDRGLHLANLHQVESGPLEEKGHQ